MENADEGTSLDVSYSATFNDHIENPRNVGELTGANMVGEETNPICGDRLRLSLIVSEGCIEDVRFLAYGCAPTLACGSGLTELLKGKSVADALRLTRKDVVDALGGLPSRKQHAAALAIETLRSALTNSGD